MSTYLLGADLFRVPTTAGYEWIGSIVTFLNDILIPGTIILAIGAAFLSIAISVALARADTPDKAEELKKRLWGLLITIFVVIALTWLLGWLLSNLPDIINAIRNPS